MGEFFRTKRNFEVIRLSQEHARAYTDHLKNFRELVLENQPMYPNIDKWFDQKVIPGIKISQRVGYIGYLDGKPAVSAIVKRGESAKFCHLKIKENLQDIHLGEAFFALMGLETRGFAKEIHFTLPETVWDKEREFFKKFAFTTAVKAGHQYRLFEDELRCSCSFAKVWTKILEKLPKIARVFSMNGHSLNNSVLMSIRAQYAKKVLAGQKKVEIRRQFSQKWAGHRVSIYASFPVSSLVGEALISKVVVDHPEIIWQKFHEQVGATKDEFDRYTKSLREVYAVFLEEVVPYKKRISLKDVSKLTERNLRPPQNYYILQNNTGWTNAVSMSALLQNSFKPQGVGAP